MGPGDCYRMSRNRNCFRNESQTTYLYFTSSVKVKVNAHNLTHHENRHHQAELTQQFEQELTFISI